MSVIKKVMEFARTYRYILIGIVVVLVAARLILGAAGEEQQTQQDVLPVVTVTSAAKLSGLQQVSVVGSVRAFNEAVITTEASGRVTSVNASLGQSVPAGFVLATLENASERAAVLQAEGAYESALASAEQGDVGLNQARTNLENAQNAALSSFESSYNTVNGIIRNNVDTFFGNPDSKVPGVKIEGNTFFLNSERVAYQELLETWQLETTTLNNDSNLLLALNNAVERVDRTIALIDVFIGIFNEQDFDKAYTEDELLGFSTTFTALRESLQGTKSSLNNSIASLDNATDALRQAEIGATGSQSSAADARVKQALGSLRSAQANLAKTILRTPISGTVNSLDVRVGDFIGMQTVAARVANNNALEVVTYVGDKEINAFEVGAEVTVEDAYTGIVTEIAPAVDPVTRKTEVRIAVETEEIKNGDTVRISKAFNAEADENQPVIVPLSAVKFEIEDGFIFVVEEGRLISRPVELGVVRGGSVEIESGLSNTDEFVLDARGLLSDTEVEVRSE